jgi:hypothetical protein
VKVRSMVSRRSFLGAASAATLAFSIREAFGLSASFNPFLSAPVETPANDNTKLVKIAIGTGGTTARATTTTTTRFSASATRTSAAQAASTSSTSC